MEKKVDSCSPTCVLEDFFKSEEFERSHSCKEPNIIDSANEQNSKQGSRRGVLACEKMSRLHRIFSPSLRGKFSLFPSFKPPPKTSAGVENLVGKGGYAEVYKGRFPNGQLVAIKRLTKGTPDEIIGDFLSELGIMAHVNHPNTAKLIGYGIEGGMHLVLDLSPNGSLASLLYGSKEKLTWGIRFKIALGTAEGLRYLHEGCKRRIIHRDIKAANILLTKDFDPQICDFGLAKWLPEQWTHHTVSKFEGTFGYLAPEYLMHGIVDEKTAVFAFGVLLLELVTGRRALDYSQQSLVLWAKPLLKKNDIRELIDPALGEDYSVQQVNLVLSAASMCIHQSSIQRPQMNQVIQLLKGNPNSLKSRRKCRVPFFTKAFHEEIYNGEDVSLRQK
ncbi:hypothetical protein V6N13_045302 [Hibiscus sabdariffa]